MASKSVPKTTQISTRSHQPPNSIVNLFRQTFASIDLTPHTSSRQHACQETSLNQSHQKKRKKVTFEQDYLNGYGCDINSMSSRSNRKLPDIRYTFSPPPMSNVTDRGDKYGTRYGSAGDIPTIAREIQDINELDMNDSIPATPDVTERSFSIYEDTIFCNEENIVPKKSQECRTETLSGDEDIAAINEQNMNNNNPAPPDVTAGGSKTYETGTDSGEEEDITPEEPQEYIETLSDDEVVSKDEDDAGLHRCRNKPFRCSQDTRDIYNSMSSQQTDSAIQTSRARPAVRVKSDNVSRQAMIENIVKDIGFYKRPHVDEQRKDRPPEFSFQKQQLKLQPDQKIFIKEKCALECRQDGHGIENILQDNLPYLHDSESSSDNEFIPDDQDEDKFEKLFLSSLEFLDDKNSKVPVRATFKSSCPERLADHSQYSTEQGAVGGISPALKPGILQRHPHTNRRHVNVHFDNEVKVETYSEREEDSSSSKSKLAHGDGPVRNSVVPIPPPLPDFISTSSPDIISLFSESMSPKYGNSSQTFEKFENDSPEYSQKVVNKKGGMKKKSSGPTRKDSLPRASSPTEFLRQKQKSVTDKILKENLSQTQNMAKVSETRVSPVTGYTRTATENYILRNETSSDQYHKPVSRYIHIENNKRRDSIDRDDILDTKKNDSYHEQNIHDRIETNHNRNTMDYPEMEESEQKKKVSNYGAYSNTAGSTLKEVECDQKADRSPGLGTFSYTTPSELFQRIEAREREKNKAEHGIETDNSPGLGAFSYTTPSELFQRIEARKEKNKAENGIETDNSPGLGAFSYTTPSELFHKIEARERTERYRPKSDLIGHNSSSGAFRSKDKLDKSSSKEQPGYWFFRRDSLDQKLQDKPSAHYQITHTERPKHMSEECVLESKENTVSEEKSCAEDDADKIKRRKKYMDRCKRKQRLDKIEQWSEDNVSNAESFDSILQSMNVKEAPTAESLNCFPLKTVKSIRDSFDSIAHSSSSLFDKKDPVSVMNDLLCEFLRMMENKQSQMLPFTLDDFKELELIYLTIVEISKQLICTIHEIDRTEETDMDTSLKAVAHCESKLSTESIEETEKYLYWLSHMLESTAYMLYSGKSVECWYTCHDSMNRGPADTSKPSESSDKIYLQNVLCDLGVIRDSMTCLLMADQSDFDSITDLGSLDTHSGPLVVSGFEPRMTDKFVELNDENEGDLRELANEREHTEEMNTEDKKQRFMQRCRRKSRLDKIENLAHSTSSNSMRLRNIVRDGTISDSFESIPLCKAFSSEKNEVNLKSVSQTLSSSADVYSPIAVTNVYLYHFLHLMKQKQEDDLSMTDNDFKELELIYDIITAIVNKLGSACYDTAVDTKENTGFDHGRSLDNQSVSSDSFLKSDQAHRYGQWLSQMISSTGSMLEYLGSSTSLQPNIERHVTGQYTAKENKMSEIEADVGRTDFSEVFNDLQMICDSMTCLLTSNQWDFDPLSDFQRRDFIESQQHIEPLTLQPYSQKDGAYDSDAIGYLADTESKDSDLHHLKHQDSILLKQYEKIPSNRDKEEGRSQFLSKNELNIPDGYIQTTEPVEKTNLQHKDSMLLKQYAKIQKIKNDEFYYIPKTTKMSEGYIQERDLRDRTDREGLEQNAVSADFGYVTERPSKEKAVDRGFSEERSLSKTDREGWYPNDSKKYYNSMGQLVFDDAVSQSPSISLRDELSLSTWGSSQDSGWSNVQGTAAEPEDVAYQNSFTAKHIDWFNSLPSDISTCNPSEDLSRRYTGKEDETSNFEQPKYRDRLMSLPVATGMPAHRDRLMSLPVETGMPTHRDRLMSLPGNVKMPTSRDLSIRHRDRLMSIPVTPDMSGHDYPETVYQTEANIPLNVEEKEIVGATQEAHSGRRPTLTLTKNPSFTDPDENETKAHRDQLMSLPVETGLPAHRDRLMSLTGNVKMPTSRDASIRYRDRLMSIPVTPDVSGHDYPETVYQTEANIPLNVDEKEIAGATKDVHPGRRPTLTLTKNPSFTGPDENETKEVYDEESEDQSALSPDSCSVNVSDPATKDDLSVLSQDVPKEITWSAQFTFPEDTSSVLVDIGPSKFALSKNEAPIMPVAEEEGSPDRSQRLFGSTQNLDRRSEAAVSKRKTGHPTGRSMTPDTRSFMMEREVTESQNRKLQTEINTLQTENKLMKEKYNRAQAKVSELETQLHNTQDDLSALQESFNQEMSDLSARTRSELDRDREQLETRIIALTKENESLKAEVSGLEKQLESSQRVTDMARHNSEKTKTLEAYKSEIASLKEELNRVKALLDQSERHLRDEEERMGSANEQLLKLTELKNALQQQADSGGSGLVTDKQLKSLEKRLKVTEERLHQERADRANNLSSVEDKLLTENARLQAVEKEHTRQLHREKERNRNLEQRLKQVREENEKLRLAMPFDDSTLLSNKDSYDIPYSSHSNQRAETMKISDDMNYILSQIERQDGIQSGQEEEMIRVLWNKRELAYKQLRDWELQLKELRLEDNNIVDGLKNLRDTYGQAESKLKEMEERVEDTRSEMTTFEATYKDQLSELVRDRHQAEARLKTAEDLLEAVRMENEILKKSQPGQQLISDSRHTIDSSHTEALQVKVTSLEGKVSQLTRQTRLLEGELDTSKAQLEARSVALQDAQNELDLAYRRLQGDGSEDRKQQKIDKLNAEVNSLQVELKLTTDKYNNLLTEKSKLDSELSNLKKSTEPHKTRQARTETIDSKVLQDMKDKLSEEAGKITSLTKRLEDAENQLQKTRQDLYIEQEHSNELETEVETLQHTVNQRAQMFEALSGTEREQHAQYQLLKETLDSVTQELSHKHAQIISLDVNLSGQKDRAAELERKLQELKSQKPGDEEPDKEEVRAGDRLRVHELELERTSLKQELSQAYSAIQASEEQFRSLQTENKQLEQEVVKEKTVILQITAEKGEIEQHLEELAEEHDALIQEKSQAEEDLIKLENKLQEILRKYEAEARRQHGDFEKQYGTLTPEASQISSQIKQALKNAPPEEQKIRVGGALMATELESLRLLLDGKEKEAEMLQDKMSRQVIEIDFLNRKVDLVHNDSIANREDVARMISELTLKMKEAVATKEVNQFLASERTKLQTEKSHIEKELEQERQNTDKRKLEITEVIRKVEHSELQQKSVVKEGHSKAQLIASLEADLRNANQNLTTTQTENTQIKNRLDHLQEDVKNLTAINATLDKRLEIEQNSLSEEKTTTAKWKEDHKAIVHELELLRHEHLVVSNKLAAEEQLVENLKKEIQTKESEIGNLQGELQNTKMDLDSNKGQLLLTKDTVHKLTADKGTIYQDYEGMCRSLTEKERQLNDLKDRNEEKLEQMKREYTAERLRLEQDKTTAVHERDHIKQELESLNDELKQKETQLSSFGKTLADLESVSRQKNELEGQLRRLEGSAGDSKLLLEGQRKELMSLNEALAKQQEEHTRLQVANRTLQMDFKSETDAANREIHELKLTLTELKSQQENERSYLNDNLAKTQTQLRAVEGTLASVTEARDSLQAHKCLADKALEETQAKLSDEATGRRLAEQSVGTLRLQLEDIRNEKTMSEARLVEARNQLSKTENQCQSEQDKNKKLSGQIQEQVHKTQNLASSIKAKDEQVDLLHKEITKMRQLLDTQKQGLSGKMKKAALEFKQKLDLVQEDKDKLSGQVQKLATDLDHCREQIAHKNKENLKMQEHIVTLEDNVRDSRVKLKQAEDSLKMESENQSQMTYRYHEQDEELKRLRSFLAKKVEESGEADKSMWHEMNRVIQELSKQMSSHLDSQKPGNGKNGDTQLIQRYKKQLSEAQGDLSTEKSLHQITKTSLQALDEDCNRLRAQLQKLRRREKSPVADRKYKNRMEAINAIIAKSQTQAQALLSSGGYLEDMNRPRVSPHHTYHSPNRPDSPDNSYASDLSIASLPPMPFSQYTPPVRPGQN